jgi:anaphase-promoting complex subunit 8
MDIYSNILYVTEKPTKLSYLAYKASSTDKYTPEANTIIGNYYSLKGDRVKAVR